MRMFTSLEELNAFLEEQGLPPLTEETIINGLAEGVDTFSFDLDDSPDINPESVFEAIMSMASDDERIDADADEETMPVADFNDYVEFSSAQIARLVEERDDARKLVQLERQSHEECHGHTLLALREMRLQGYAESIAAGLFPGKPFETLTEDQQEVLLRQAQQSIENIDIIRAELQTRGTVSVH